MDERIGDCADCPIYGTLTQCMCGSWICEECRPWHEQIEQELAAKQRELEQELQTATNTVSVGEA